MVLIQSPFLVSILRRCISCTPATTFHISISSSSFLSFYFLAPSMDLLMHDIWPMQLRLVPPMRELTSYPQAAPSPCTISHIRSVPCLLASSSVPQCHVPSTWYSPPTPSSLPDLPPHTGIPQSHPWQSWRPGRPPTCPPTRCPCLLRHLRPHHPPTAPHRLFLVLPAAASHLSQWRPHPRPSPLPSLPPYHDTFPVHAWHASAPADPAFP